MILNAKIPEPILPIAALLPILSEYFIAFFVFGKGPMKLSLLYLFYRCVFTKNAR